MIAAALCWVALTNQISPDKVWQDLVDRQAIYQSLSYSFKLISFRGKRSDVEEHGSASYFRGGAVSYEVRDNSAGVNASYDRDREGKWQGSASDDANSTMPGNNALGYPDSIPGKYSFLPLLAIEGTGIDVLWRSAAKTEFRGSPCFLLRGEGGGDSVSLWIESKRMVILRIQQDSGNGRKRVTAFEKIEIR